MADFTLTPADMRDLSGKAKLGIGGAAIDAGMAVYKDTDGKWQKARANAAITAGSAGKIGIAVTECQEDGAPIFVLSEPNTDFENSGMTPGQPYLVSSATAGLFAPLADVETANGYSTLAFMALTATRARFLGVVSGVTI